MYDIVNFLESKTSLRIEALFDSLGCRGVWNQRRRPHGEVTLKTGGETGGAVDHTLFACVSLAVMGSVALVTVGKSSPLFFFVQGGLGKLDERSSTNSDQRITIFTTDDVTVRALICGGGDLLTSPPFLES